MITNSLGVELWVRVLENRTGESPQAFKAETGSLNSG